MGVSLVVFSQINLECIFKKGLCVPLMSQFSGLKLKALMTRAKKKASKVGPCAELDNTTATDLTRK